MRFLDKNVVIGVITSTFVEITDSTNIELDYFAIKIEPYIYRIEELVFDDFLRSTCHSSDIRGLWLLDKKVVGMLISTIIELELRDVGDIC